MKNQLKKSKEIANNVCKSFNLELKSLIAADFEENGYCFGVAEPGVFVANYEVKTKSGNDAQLFIIPETELIGFGNGNGYMLNGVDLNVVWDDGYWDNPENYMKSIDFWKNKMVELYTNNF